MRQRIFFRTLLGAQFLVFLVLFGGGVYCLWLTRSPDILSEPDAADTVHGLRLGAAAALSMAAIWGASFSALLRRQAWGWWLGFAASVFVLGATSWGLIDDLGSNDFDDYLVPAIFLLVVVLHLLGRPTLWRLMDAPVEAVENTSQSAGSGI